MALVRNVGKMPLHVGIIQEDGSKTTIRVMPSISRSVSLPPGSQIDPVWLALEGKDLRVFDDPKPVTATNDAPDVPTETDKE